MTQRIEGEFFVLEEDTNFDTRFEEHQDFAEILKEKEFLKIKTIEGNRFSTPFQDIWTNPEQTHQVYFVHDPIFNINYFRIRGDYDNEPESIRKVGGIFSGYHYTEFPDILGEAIENGKEDEIAQAVFSFAVGLAAWYDPRKSDAFKICLEQPSVKVRLATIRAVGFQLWNECAPILENLISSDPNPAVREYATQTLKQIQQPDFDPDDLYENPSNYPHSFERITEKGLMILPQIKDDLQTWMKQQGYQVVDALVLYQYLVEVYGEFKPTDEPVEENETAESQIENEDNSEQTTETTEPEQPEITQSERLQQQIAHNKKQLKELRSRFKTIEERIQQDRKTNIFGRKQSGKNEEERDRLVREIEEIKQRIRQNESLLKAEESIE